MTPDKFRQLALDFSEASESAHMHHPDFRVSGRIFATLGYPDSDSAMVKLSANDQKQFVETDPTVFKPVKGAWGRQGATTIHLPGQPSISCAKRCMRPGVRPRQTGY